MKTSLQGTVARIGGIGVLALGVLGCGGGGPGAFVGTYSGNTSATVTITQPIQESNSSMTAQTITISASSAAGVDMIVNTGNTGAGDCILNFIRMDNTANLMGANQTCQFNTGGLAFTATWTTGTMTLSGTTLTATLNGNISGTTSTGIAFTGTTMSSFQGTRR